MPYDSLEDYCTCGHARSVHALTPNAADCWVLNCTCENWEAITDEMWYRIIKTTAFQQLDKPEWEKGKLLMDALDRSTTRWFHTRNGVEHVFIDGAWIKLDDVSA